MKSRYNKISSSYLLTTSKKNKNVERNKNVSFLEKEQTKKNKQPKS